MSIISKIKVAACGIEEQLLIRAGISPDVFNGKPQPCPSCGGDDRFEWYNKGSKKGIHYCRHCGGGDWISLLQKVQGEGMKKTLSWLADELGLKDMSAEEKQAVDLRAERLRRQAEASATLERENQHLDWCLTSDLDELDWIMKKRQHKSRNGTEQMVRMDEIAQLKRASLMITERGANILSSSSYKKARQVYRQLKPHAGTVSESVIDYANSLNENNIFDYDRKICDTIMVREMLIDKKDLNFMAQVLAHVRTLDKPEIIRQSPVVNVVKTSDFFTEAFISAARSYREEVAA